VSTSGYREFLQARDLLQAHRTDYDAALAGFTWPRPAEFNWALEHIDAVAANPVRGQRLALWIVEEDGSEAKYTFADMSERSNRVANWLRQQGVARGERLVLMLANQVQLWETILAVMKLGAVLIPTTPCSVPPTSPTGLPAGPPSTWWPAARTQQSSPVCPGSTPASRWGRRCLAGWTTPKRFCCS